MEPKYDAAAANLIRTNLKAHHLDIPGTVCFDDVIAGYVEIERPAAAVHSTMNMFYLKKL